jgi:hypothetical protein
MKGSHEMGEISLRNSKFINLATYAELLSQFQIALFPDILN